MCRYSLLTRYDSARPPRLPYSIRFFHRFFSLPRQDCWQFTASLRLTQAFCLPVVRTPRLASCRRRDRNGDLRPSSADELHQSCRRPTRLLIEPLVCFSALPSARRKTLGFRQVASTSWCVTSTLVVRISVVLHPVSCIQYTMNPQPHAILPPARREFQSRLYSEPFLPPVTGP